MSAMQRGHPGGIEGAMERPGAAEVFAGEEMRSKSGNPVNFN